MAVTADRVVVELQAKTEAYDAKIANSARNFDAKVQEMATTANQAGNAAASAFEGANSSLLKFGRGGSAAAQGLRVVSSEARATQQQMRNLAFQFQDIGTMMASGQSPFILLAQQLPQVTMHGGSLGGVMGALRSTVAGLISPLGLATTAFVLLGSAAIDYFSDLMSSSDEGDVELDKHIKKIGSVVDAWGEAVPALKDYYDELKKRQSEAELKQASNEAIENVTKGAREGLTGLRSELAGLLADLSTFDSTSPKIGVLQKAFQALAVAVESNKGSTREQKELLDALEDTFKSMPVNGIQPLIDRVKQLAVTFDEAAKSAGDLASEANRVSRGLTGPDLAAARSGQIPLPSSAPTPDLRPSFEDIGQSLDSISAAIKGFADRVVQAESGGNRLAKNPNSSATGLGQFIESTWLDLFRKYYPEQAAGMSRDAILALRKDADVSYALIQKYAGENARVLQAAGVTVNEAALQLAHFLGAGDAAKVMNAAPGTPLAGLISAKSIAANPTILGGGRTVDDAIAYAERRASASGAGSSRSRRTPVDIFQGSVDQVQKRIDALNAEYAAQSKLNPLIKDYGFAAEKARIEANLLADAHRAGVEVTPELASKLSTLAENYAAASSSGKQLEDQQRKIVQQQQDFNDLSADIFSGVIQGLRDGKSAGEIFAGVLDKIANKIQDIALEALFPRSGVGGLFGGGKGGLLGGLLLPGILHDGGVAGADGYGHGRAVSPRTFAGAQRYHTGGIAGLQPGEVPAILQRGEVVLPRGAGVGGVQSVVINAPISAPGADAAALARVERSVNELGKNIPKMVDQRVDNRQTRKVRA